MEKQKAKAIEKIIRLVYESLESHLRYTYIKTEEGEKFHKKAVDDYIEILNQIKNLW